MEFSERVLSMSPSGTLKLVELANQLKLKGHRIISFAVGEPDFTTPQTVIEAAYEAAKNGKTHYTPPLGIRELREKIAEKYQRENHVNVSAENVMVTPAKMAIFMAVAGFVDPGDEVLIPDPGWVSYKEMVHFARGKPVGYRLDEEKDYSLDIDDLLGKINSKTKMIIINSPSNPTGTVFSQDDIKAIRDIVLDYNLVLVSDEIYEKIIYEGEHISPGIYEELLGNLIIVNGFSKSHAMTGWRIGYLIAPKDIINQLSKIQQHTISCAPSIAQYGVLRALEDKESVKRMVEEFTRRREFVYNSLKEIDGLDVMKPRGTFYVFPRYKYPIPSGELAEKILMEKHIALTPGSAFGKYGEYHFRLSFASSMENLEEGISRLRDFFSSLS